MNNLDCLILKLDDCLKTLGFKYVYCGSISHYLHGMNVSSFNDADIDFIELDWNQRNDICLKNCPIYIDIMFPIDGLTIEWDEIEFYGRILLASTLNYEICSNRWLMNIPNYSKMEKSIKREKLLKEFLDINN